MGRILNNNFRIFFVSDIAKNLIKIEKKWLNNIKNAYQETKQTPPYNQLDLDSLVKQMNQDTSE